jgi:toxin ParE1/3/4
MARIIRAPAAETDAVEIWAYIAADNPSAADRLLDRFDRIFQKLATQPLLGRAVEQIAPNLRFIPIGSYLVFYRVTEDGVEIARILHGARDITAEFFRD